MRRFYTFLFLAFLVPSFVKAQITTPVSLTSGTYSQDFNTLATSGTTNSATPVGWGFSESGSGANTSYSAGTGSGTAGDTYSFGTASSSERAFGALRSNAVGSIIGAAFTNNTGTTITSITISYTGEQWRLGALDRTDQLSFQYSTDATSLTNGAWTSVSGLNFITPNTTGGTGAKDGNLATNRTAFTNIIVSGLSIPANNTFYIRWVDTDPPGSDDGLAIDDFSLSLGSTGPAQPTVSISASSDLVEPTTNGGFTISLSATQSTVTTINYAVAGTATNGTDYTTLSGTATIAANTASVIVPVNVIDDNSVEGAEMIIITLAAAPSGFALGTPSTVTLNISDNDTAPVTGSFAADFNTCAIGSPGTVTGGFTRINVTGAQVWDCTTSGRNGTNGLQMNGFVSGVGNVSNEDWLITPALDLSGTAFPLFSFWSRTRFNGRPLELKISTNYNGSGNPTTATWTDLNGKFPAPTTDVWTLSNNINLSAYKQAGVYIAFVYKSSDEEGARWTIDDVALENSATPPPASLTTSTNDLQFNFVANGSSAIRSLIVTGNDITSDLTLTATGAAFSISRDNVNFGNSVTFATAEANNTPRTVYVRFTPTQEGVTFNGNVNINTSSLTSAVALNGSSIDPANTLEVINWNIEWFGSTSNGPANETLQEQNVVTLMRNANADIYALAEIVNESKLAAVVNQLPGYSYVISNYGSHTNTSANPASALAAAQKLAFVYRTNMFSNISTTALLSQGINSSADLSNPAYNYFASGRFPYMLSADVNLNGNTKNMKFILLHAKANTDPVLTSYDRRKKGSDTLYFTLQQNYASDNVVLLGDLNDDLDQTITDGVTPPVTSYMAFTSDGTNFFSPTLSLSQAGKKSTVSYNDVIDHVIVSNEARVFYINGSASILTDLAASIPSYGSTTSDHYPVFTRYDFSQVQIPLPATLTSFNAQKSGSAVRIDWTTASEQNTKEFVVERSVDGRSFTAIGKRTAAGNSNASISYQFIDTRPNAGSGWYRLRTIDLDGKQSLSRQVKVDLSRAFTVTLAPNPASTTLYVNSTASGPVLLQLSNINGKLVRTENIVNGYGTVNLTGLAKGLYLVRVQTAQGISTEKLMIE